jgi:hypothetical protein
MVLDAYINLWIYHTQFLFVIWYSHVIVNNYFFLPVMFFIILVCNIKLFNPDHAFNCLKNLQNWLLFVHFLIWGLYVCHLTWELFVCWLEKCLLTWLQFVTWHENCLSVKGPLWSWSYCTWISNYLCNRCLSPLMLWVYFVQH